MGYDTGGLLADVGFKLQNNPRYTRAIRLDGLNRAIEKTILFASDDYDVREVQNPPDPSGQFSFAMEWPLPTDLLYLASVSAKGYPLKPVSQAEFVSTRAEQSQDIAFVPSIYYVRANRYLNVWPRPSAQNLYQIYGVFKPADLVLDTDPIPMNRQYSDALVSYAAWWSLQGQTDEAIRAAGFMSDYMNQRAEAKYNLSLNTVYTTKNVKPQR